MVDNIYRGLIYNNIYRGLIYRISLRNTYNPMNNPRKLNKSQNTHTPEQLNLKGPAISRIGKNVEQCNFHIASRSMNWCNDFGKPALSIKIEQTHILLPSNSTPRYTPRINVYIYAPKGLYKNSGRV